MQTCRRLPLRPFKPGAGQAPRRTRCFRHVARTGPAPPPARQHCRSCVSTIMPCPKRGIISGPVKRGPPIMPQRREACMVAARCAASPVPAKSGALPVRAPVPLARGGRMLAAPPLLFNPHPHPPWRSRAAVPSPCATKMDTVSRPSAPRPGPAGKMQDKKKKKKQGVGGAGGGGTPLPSVPSGVYYLWPSWGKMPISLRRRPPSPCHPPSNAIRHPIPTVAASLFAVAGRRALAFTPRCADDGLGPARPAPLLSHGVIKKLIKKEETSDLFLVVVLVLKNSKSEGVQAGGGR